MITKVGKHRNPMFNNPLIKKRCPHGGSTKSLHQENKMKVKREYPVIWTLEQSVNNSVFAI